MRAIRAVLIVGTLLGSTCFADQLAQFQSIGQGQDYHLLTIAGVEHLDTTAGGVNISFSWNPATGLGSFINSFLTLDATSSTAATQDANVPPNISETGFSGTFSICLVAAAPVCGAGQNLLSGSFGPSGLLTLSGSGGGFTDTTPPAGEVTFTSDFINFGNTNQRGFSLAFTNGTPSPAALTGGFPVNESLAGDGTFSATPLPGTPEPGTLALLGSALVGLGLIGRKHLVKR